MSHILAKEFRNSQYAEFFIDPILRDVRVQYSPSFDAYRASTSDGRELYISHSLVAHSKDPMRALHDALQAVLQSSDPALTGASPSRWDAVNEYLSEALGVPASMPGIDKNNPIGYNAPVSDNDDREQDDEMMQQTVFRDANGREYRTDVVLEGRRIGLGVLRQALKAKKISQTEISSRTRSFTEDGNPVHQTTVSAHLRGEHEMNEAIAQVLIAEFREELEELERKSATLPPPQAATVRRSPSMPKFAKTLQSIPVVDDGVPVPSVFRPSAEKREEKKLASFPVQSAQQVADMVRKGLAEGSISTTFSMRKLMLWGQGFYLLLSEGYSYEDALSGGYHVAVEAKAPRGSEDSRFLKEAFNSVFGIEAREPKVHASTARKDGNRHPQSYLSEPFVRECIPLWMVGPTGSGKTHAAEEIAQRLGRKSLRIQGSSDTTVDDLVGGFGASGGSTYFEYGPLPLAMQNGWVLIVDEISTYPPEVLMELQAVLEGKPLVLKRNRGEVIQAAPGFTIVAGDNTVGLGESMEYVGTNVMNEAFRDRFAFVHFGYLAPSQEKEAVEEVLEKFLSVRNWSLI